MNHRVEQIRAARGRRLGAVAGAILAAGVVAAVVSGSLLPAASAEALAGTVAARTSDDGAAGPFAEVSGLSERLETITGLGDSSASVEAPDALGLPDEGAGSPQFDGERIAVSVRYAERPSADDFAALARLAEVVASSSELARATAYALPSSLDAIAALPRVASVTEALRPGTGTGTGTDTGTPNPAITSAPAAAASAEPTASADPSCRSVEAVAPAPLRADVASALHGVDGSGVTVGIISDSFSTSSTALSTPADDIAAGLLPGPGNPCGRLEPVLVVRDDPTGSTVDEGRGMAQVVHSVAPGAKLAFASVGADELTLHDAILALADAGATVIVDDVYLFDEPFFQQGAAGVAIEQVAARGVTYLTSAGNYNIYGAPGFASAGHPVNGWETTRYRPTSCPDAVLAKLGEGRFDCMDFAQGGAAPDPTDTLTLEKASSPSFVALQWSEPVGFAKGRFLLALTDQDGDVSLFDERVAGTPIMTSGFQPVATSDYHFSIVRDTTAGAEAAIEPAVKWVWSFRQGLLAAEYFGVVGDDRVGTTIAGHGGLPTAVSVAALPSDDPTAPELFSSHGPSTQYYDYDPAVSPVPVPLAGPVVTAKPDVSGVDRILTNFFSSHRPVEGRPGVHAFWGTSAAAPTAAAVVALGRQYSPAAGPTELRAALAGTAVAVSSGNPATPAPEVTGTGRIDATAFLAALPDPGPAPTPVPSPAPAPGPTPAPSPDGPHGSGSDSSELAATGTPTGPLTGLALLSTLTLTLGASLLATRTFTRRRRGHRSLPNDGTSTH